MKLRSYQEQIFERLISSRSNDLVQLDTGAGKTPIEAAIAKHYPHVMLVAHRNILITQISEKLAAFGVSHNTVSTEYTRRRCMLSHRQHGKNYIDHNCTTKLVVSVDSLHAHQRRGLLRVNTALPWVIVVDEAHHVVPDNKWGQLKTLFPNSRIIGFTATPARMDGESLHIDNGGLFDQLVQAPNLQKDSVKTLIAAGYLCKFKVYAPTNEDFEQITSNAADKELTIIGDPVVKYKQILIGKQAVMFCPSIRNSKLFAAEFKQAGIPSAHIGSDLSRVEISRIIDAFRNRQIKVLTNVDMVSEGFDMPGIEALIFAKKTQSFIAYRQWVGRALRPYHHKQQAIIIDHVGNVIQHGMPDDHIEWNLKNPPRDAGKLKTAPCYKCGLWYPVKKRLCPECGASNKLLTRETIGGYYVDIAYRLDLSLVAKASSIYKAELLEQRLSQELIWPYFPENCGAVASIINKIRKWFIAELQQQNVKTREINRFLTSDACRSDKFWFNNFTAADVGNSNKAQRIYNKWQKQH